MREGVIYVLVCHIYNLIVYLSTSCAYSFTNWHSLQGACNTKEVKFICTLNRGISLMGMRRFYRIGENPAYVLSRCTIAVSENETPPKMQSTPHNMLHHMTAKAMYRCLL